MRAKNRFGYSNFSEASEARDIEKIRISQGSYYYKSEQTIVGALIAGGVLFAMLLLVTCLVVHKNRRIGEKKKLGGGGGGGVWDQMVGTVRSPDLELANLRELPLRPGFVNANNPMYQIDAPTDEELSLIRKIKRSQITLTKFIGR